MAKRSTTMAAPADEPEAPPPPKESALEMIASGAATLAVVLFIMTFNVQAFEIPSSSMERTLLIGDHVFVDRITSMAEPAWMPLIPHRAIRRGDIIVFFKPGEPGLHLVKRVVGVPGDRIHLRDGVVYRNGEAQREPYVIHSVGNIEPYRDNFPDVAPVPGVPITPDWELSLPQYMQGQDMVVPPGSYFAMGDNRDVSLDSRYWGFVPEANIIGRPVLVYWSFETPSDQVDKTSAGDRIAFAFHVALHFFDQTRWKRMGRVPH